MMMRNEYAYKRLVGIPERHSLSERHIRRRQDNIKTGLEYVM
jgi:hypothetical protein